MGRFTQEDSYRGDGLNLYAYCGIKPVMYYDSSGHGVEDKCTKPQQNESKTPKSGTGKEKATDVPSWAKGNRSYKEENGKDFAKRLCDELFGEGNYDTKGQSDYSNIKKWGDRGFE